MSRKQRRMMARIFAATALMLALQLLGASAFDSLGAAGRWLRLALYLADYLLIGYDILRKAFKGIVSGRIFDECFLMTVATLGAMALAIASNGDYVEAIAVMLFYQIGEWFQSYAVGRSRKNITQLMDIRPDYANLEQDGALRRVDPEEVAIGSVIVVQPGEKIPLDGVVISGASSLNTAALTGESLPRDVTAGDSVLSGCICLTGVLKIQTTREFGESTVSKVLDLVENASSRKSKSEDFITKFARYYTPAVCAGALALAIVPPLVLLALGRAAMWGTWLYRALNFLVISCPCALVISIPLSFFAGIGAASHEGVLVKGSNYLEALAQVDTVVFDKTGTLTQGVFQVTGIADAKMDENRLLYFAAHAECASPHPIAKSLREAYGAPIDRTMVSDFQEQSGRGLTACVDGVPVACGNAKLLDALGIAYPSCGLPGTLVYVAVDGEFAGTVVISDRVKDGAADAIAALKKSGVKKCVMLTGDSESAAGAVGAQLRLDEVYSRLLPADKVERVEQLLAAQSGGSKLAFVGDGINDAPVLSRADIGIAMGALGSDAAIEAADVVLMDDDPRKIVTAMHISRKCLRIVYQNITLALAIKFLCLLLGACGMTNMYMAIFADVGVMVLAVLNAVRCLRV
ncbi:MAG: cadmium-translocating P-type ATPase [Firmicutes bacterium]|nr:cadmium-translocating P-type ATPase [Bacillota bacterium]